jgi:hypothetical protein
MRCDEWRNLVVCYLTAVHAYSAAVDRLSVETDADFNEAWQQAESARKNTDTARATLLHHEHDHACFRAHLTNTSAG